MQHFSIYFVFFTKEHVKVNRLVGPQLITNFNELAKKLLEFFITSFSSK